MRLIRHGDYLVQLTQIGMMNCFLVSGEDGLTLIDTLGSGQASGILDAARELDAPIVRAAITHAHFDHCGSLDALVEHLPSLEIGISVRETRLIDGDFSSEPGEPDAKPRGMHTDLESRPTRLLHEAIASGRWRWWQRRATHRATSRSATGVMAHSSSGMRCRRLAASLSWAGRA